MENADDRLRQPRFSRHERPLQNLQRRRGAPAWEAAFLPLEKRLFWPNETPKNADSSSAFAADIRGNLKK